MRLFHTVPKREGLASKRAKSEKSAPKGADFSLHELTCSQKVDLIEYGRVLP